MWYGSFIGTPTSGQSPIRAYGVVSIEALRKTVCTSLQKDPENTQMILKIWCL